MERTLSPTLDLPQHNGGAAMRKHFASGPWFFPPPVRMPEAMTARGVLRPALPAPRMWWRRTTGRPPPPAEPARISPPAAQPNPRQRRKSSRPLSRKRRFFACFSEAARQGLRRRFSGVGGTNARRGGISTGRRMGLRAAAHLRAAVFCGPVYACQHQPYA